MRRMIPPLMALFFLLNGCASTTRPLGSFPPAAVREGRIPLPWELLRLPEAPPPLTPGYSREHP